MSMLDDLMDSLLVKHSAETAFSTLTQAGYTVSIHKLHSRLSRLIAAGKRQPIAQKDRAKLTAHHNDIPKGASLEGSEKLLAACLALYQRRAASAGVSVQDAMLFMLNAPERLAA